MKFNHLRAFEKHLADAAPNRFCPLYLLIDKDSYNRKVALDKLRNYFFGNSAHSSGALTTAFQVFDAEKLSVGEFLGELNTGGLFSARRLIVLQKAENLDKAASLPIENYLANPCPDLCLAITATQINHSTNFYRKCEKAGIILEIPEEKPWEKERSAQNWIAATLAEERKTITPQASQQLVKALGAQPSVLISELQKLISYVGPRSEIHTADVAAICSSACTETGWQLGEALFRKEAPLAFKIGKGLFLDGLPLIALLRLIRSQYQTALQIATLLGQGGAAEEVGKLFPYMRGAILERHISLARGCGKERLKSGLLIIDAAELQAKNSRMDDDLLLELTLIKLLG